MDILKRLSGWTDGMSNADVYKLAHDEIALLRAQLAAQPAPSQSEAVGVFTGDFCPTEMTKEQITTFEQHQVLVRSAGL